MSHTPPAPSIRRPRRHFAPATLAVAVMVAAAALGACGGSSPVAGPRLRVVATNFALSELVRGVGGTAVTVSDLAAGAPDDRTILPTTAQRAMLTGAQLVVEVGGGWQPRVEAAAGTSSRVLAVGHQGAANGSQVWLDPVSMEAAARQLATKLVALDPAGASTFGNGVRDFNDNLASVGVDYQSSLAACQYHLMFAPDAAFGVVASRYTIKLQVVGAGLGTPALDAAVSSARAQQFHAVFDEPPLASPGITALAAPGKAKIGGLDTMDGPPIRTEPTTSTYVDRLEANLEYLTGGLYCQDNSGLS